MNIAKAALQQYLHSAVALVTDDDRPRCGNYGCTDFAAEGSEYCGDGCKEQHDADCAIEHDWEIEREDVS